MRWIDHTRRLQELIWSHGWQLPPPRRPPNCVWPHHWSLNSTSERNKVIEDDRFHPPSGKKLVVSITRYVEKLSFPTSKSRCRWQNGITSTTMVLRLVQIRLLKTVLRMRVLGGVLRTTEATTSVNARSSLSDVGLEGCALTNAEVSLWYLGFSVNGRRVQMSQIDKSRNREDRKRVPEVF